MQLKSSEILDKIKELRNLSNETNLKLEKDGMSITNISMAQLFDYNIKNIISAIESLLRNEPSERPILRLEKEIPDFYINIEKIKETPQGRLNSQKLERLRELINFLEKNYKRI